MEAGSLILAKTMAACAQSGGEGRRACDGEAVTHTDFMRIEGKAISESVDDPAIA
jgi:hypothetical protein